MNRNEVAHEYLLDKSHGHHERINDLITINGLLEVNNHEPNELIIFLARTVVGQQLSAKAARTIWKRVEALHTEIGCDLKDVFSVDNVEKLRECGVSGNKTRALIGLSEAVDNNLIDGADILNSSYTEVIEKVTSLWGFGNWSADMCAMFFCGLPDIYPQSDVAIQQGLNRLCGDDRKPDEVADTYAPYRTYLCRHIWLGLDSGYLD